MIVKRYICAGIFELVFLLCSTFRFPSYLLVLLTNGSLRSIPRYPAVVTKRQQLPHRPVHELPAHSLTSAAGRAQLMSLLQAPTCPPVPVLQGDTLGTLPLILYPLLLGLHLLSCSHICVRSNSYIKSLIP